MWPWSGTLATTSVVAEVLTAIPQSGPLVANPGVEQRVDDVQQQRRQTDADDDEVDHAINGEIVESSHGPVQQGTHARVAKDDFDQERAADEMAQRYGQRRRLRQQCVAHAIPEEDASCG